ncbi:unnamed protein product [Closterium sp. NIES-53]
MAPWSFSYAGKAMILLRTAGATFLSGIRSCDTLGVAAYCSPARLRVALTLDFFPLSADPSLLVRRGLTPFFVLVYVDDLVFATPDRRSLASVKEGLQRRHTCTDLGASRGATRQRGGRSAKDADKAKTAKDGGCGGRGRRWECWLCDDPDHLSFECPDYEDSDDDDTKGGHGRSARHRPRRESNLRMENLSTKSTSTKDADYSYDGKGRGNGCGCSHHLIGTKEAFIDLGPSGDVKHVRDFNGELQDVQGRGTVALKGEAGKQVLVPDVLYVPGVHANLLSAGQLQESDVRLQDNGDEIMHVSGVVDVLGWEKYTGRVLCTNLRSCTATSTMMTTETVALQTIATATKSTPARWHVRLAHVDVDTIISSAKHEVATGLVITPSAGADLLCVSCFNGKLTRHTFPDKGSDADDALAVDRKTCYVWVRPVAKKSDVLQEFENLTLEMWTVVESVRTMLLHMGVQHHWWHLALRQAVWVRNCLERSTLPPRTTPYLLLTNKKPNLTLAWVWGCMAQFLVSEQHYGGKLAPKARWGLHLGVSEESKGWEVLDLTDNKVVTTSDMVFYKTMSLEMWKSEHGPAS